VLEEIVADLVGLIHGLGEYSSEAALRFFGLEGFPGFRPGGRLEVYRGDPPITDGAFEVLKSLTRSAIINLENVCRTRPDLASDPSGLAELVFALTSMTLEEFAADDAAERIVDQWNRGREDPGVF
jgi:hypothetical protein